MQDKKDTRGGLFFIIGAVLLFIFFIFFGLPFFARVAIFLSDFKKSNVPVQQEDKVPPGPPRIDQLPSYTKDELITVSGAAEAGSSMKFYKNDEVVKETVIDDTSTYSFELELDKGENVFTAMTKDQAGNESEKAPVVRVIYNDEEPKLEVTYPIDGAIIDGKKAIVIEGATSSGNKVTINDRVAIVEEDGSFSLNFNLEEGENRLVFTAEDPAANFVEREFRVSYAP
ncbi:MAG: Ig-like domain-containing protein [bacterium]|nr:Ig-like domain-containing protein [bacterium]